MVLPWWWWYRIAEALMFYAGSVRVDSYKGWVIVFFLYGNFLCRCYAGVDTWLPFWGLAYRVDSFSVVQVDVEGVHDTVEGGREFFGG